MRNLVPISLLLVPGWAAAQTLEPDEEGCKDSKLLTRMPKCRISECSRKDFDSAELTVGFKDEEWQAKTLEGATEILTYECPANVSPVQIARNMEGAMRQAGYRVVYSGTGQFGPLVTAQNGAQWIEVQTWKDGESPNYKQTAVKVQQLVQEVAATADAWAAEIEKSGRVSVYGINFDTGKSSITLESEKVLQEILTLLKTQAGWKLRVEGHTDSVGAKAANQALSRQRAAAVVAWLVAHGIDKSRLAAEGFGDTKPVAGHDTDDGRARNRRVELVKM